MTHVYHHIQLPQEYLPGNPILFQSSDGKEHSISLPDTFSHKPGDIIYCALPNSQKNTQQLVRIDESQLIKEFKQLKAQSIHNSDLIKQLKAQSIHNSELKESKARIDLLNYEFFSMKTKMYQMQARLSQMSESAQAEKDSGTLNTLGARAGEIICSEGVRNHAAGVFIGPPVDVPRVAAAGKTKKKRKKETHKRIRRTHKQIQDGIPISEIRNNTQHK